MWLDRSKHFRRLQLVSSPESSIKTRVFTLGIIVSIVAL